MVEKLNKLNNWSVKRDDRYGPLASRWYKAQEKPGALKNTWEYTDWAGGAPYRGAKGAGQMCFATGVGPTDLQSNDVKRQMNNGECLPHLTLHAPLDTLTASFVLCAPGYHVPIRVPTAHRGVRPPYSLPFYSHSTLRGPPSPPRSARREEVHVQPFATLPWKGEWYGQPQSLEKPGSRFAETFHVSNGGEGMAPSHDIGKIGLLSQTRQKPRDVWTVSRPLGSPQRATTRLRKLETRGFVRSGMTNRRSQTGISNR